jgi:hypothetical protein
VCKDEKFYPVHMENIKYAYVDDKKHKFLIIQFYNPDKFDLQAINLFLTVRIGSS